jgi:agmatinase
MTQALTSLGKRQTVSAVSPKPKLMTLGGDHSLTLPALRALNEIYGQPIQVLHFDGALDITSSLSYTSDEVKCLAGAMY